MLRRPIGGVPIAAIGQGTWAIVRDDRAELLRALRRGLDLGMTHVDTAEMYGDGRVEEIVAEAIRGRRDEVYLVSKVLPSNATFEGTLRACERSLHRLATDRLDLYLLHWRESDSPPLADTFRAFDRLLRDGKIRAFGVSNFDIADLEEAWALDRRLACNQVLYHVAERSIEHAVIPWCEARGVAVVAYSPFASGAFDDRNPALRAVGARLGATPRQVALAYLLRQPSVLTIPKAGRVAHVEENAAAAGLELSHADVAAIEAALPLGPPKPLPMI
jgi:diketogulonate reductase-like aldo/keto reductase